MPNYKVEIDLAIEKICYYGTKIDCRNGIYLQIDVFNKLKYSKQYSARFPIQLCENFCFRELYFDMPNCRSVGERLSDEPVTIELIETDCVCADASIAYFDTDVCSLTELGASDSKRCYNRRIAMINKNYNKSCDSPTLIYSSYICISKLLSYENESRYCPSPCITRPKRDPCCPSISRCCPSTSSLDRLDCSRRTRRISPILCPPRRRCPSLSRPCTPTIPSSRRISSICKPRNGKWDIEIARLTKNLREVSDQIRQLTGMHKYRTELIQSRCCPRPTSMRRFPSSMPCRRPMGHRWTI